MATSQKNIDHIHQIVMGDRRLTVDHIANVMMILHKRVENMFHKET